MTVRILVIGTETIGEKDLTHMTEYRPGEDDVTLDHEQGLSSDDFTATISLVNPAITHYTSTAPVGSANVAHHLGVLPEPMDFLQYQWENAEVPTADTPIREGDTLIRKDHDTAFEVWVCVTGGRAWGDDARILKRAPRREPWQALADVIRQWDATPETGHTTDSMARWFYERGVRVTGGDEA